MPRPLKTDIAELRELHAKGMRPIDIAKQLGVSKSAISRHLKRLKLTAVKHIAIKDPGKLAKTYSSDIDEFQAIVEEVSRIRKELSTSTDRADMDLSLKACNQGLKQIMAKGELAKIWHEINVFSMVFELLIDLLRQTSPKLRDDFIKRLKEDNVLRRALRAKPVKPLDDENKSFTCAKGEVI